MAMELKVLTPEEQWIAQGIHWNHEELKMAIASKMQDYVGIQYTEDTIKEAKKDKANLNKLRTALEDERKRVKKQCMAPYEEFEKQVKEIVAIIDEPIALIDKQIKEVEEQRRAEKKEKVLEIYNECIGNLKGMLPFERVFKPEYLNVSKSLKSITDEIQELVDRVNRDMDTIEDLDSNYEVQVKDMYIKTLDLSLALHENARLEEVAKKAAEERARREAEIERRKAEETKKAEETRNAEKSKLAEEKASEEKAAEEKPVNEAPAEEDPEVKYVIDFRVECTLSQLEKLKGFLLDNEIKYGPVSK